MKHPAGLVIFLLMFVLTRTACAEGAATPVSSGTAFRVSHDGHLLTNYHVIKGCRSLTAYMPSDHPGDPSTVALDMVHRWFFGEQAIEARPVVVKVLQTDPQNDLALLLPESMKRQRTEKIGTRVKPWEAAAAVSWYTDYARFRDGANIDLGESVTVVGFPLQNVLTKINVTDGKVSSLAPGNNEKFFQITAPIQAGNSGGPVLDDRGNVIGVVVASLDPLQMLQTMGDIPQNINFAIHGAIARKFLQSFLSALDVVQPTGEKKDTVAIARDAVRFTFPVFCYQ
jgi:S1-C subfamily serine protease